MTPHTDIALRDWLLDRLDATSADSVEESLFVDAEQADAVDAMQRDLFDAAAAGHLEEADTLTLSRRAHANVRLHRRWLVARALSRRTAQRRAKPRRRVAWWSAALAACLILCTLAAIKFWPNADANVPTISLRATAQRSAATISVVLPPNSGLIRLQADIGDANDGATFNMIVSEDGKTLFAANGLGVHRAGQIRFVEATMPTSSLGPGPRHITVSTDGAAIAWDVIVTPH